MENFQETKSNKPSMVSQIVALLLTTLIAFGGGWGFGKFVLSDETGASAGSMNIDEADSAAGGKADMAGHADAGNADATAEPPVDDTNTASLEADEIAAGNAVPLEPIIANLASPNDTWVRLELSVMFGSTPEPETVNAIHQDILAYIKTVKLHQVDGPSGYVHLKTDLRDLAIIRSRGEARDVLIRALLFE